MSLTTAKPQLYEDILAIFEYEAGQVDNPQESRKRIAQKLTNAIDKYVRAGKVEVDAGVSVSTTGTSTAQTGATTAKGIGKMI